MRRGPSESRRYAAHEGWLFGGFSEYRASPHSSCVPKRDPDRAAIEVGLRISELRRHRGITQENLADRLGLSRKYIAEIEQGRKVISIWRLFQIANAIGVDPRSCVEPPKRTTKYKPGHQPRPYGPYQGTEFVGVFWRSGAYWGRVEKAGDSPKLVGGFATAEEAARARDELALQLGIRNPQLNFSPAGERIPKPKRKPT